MNNFAQRYLFYRTAKIIVIIVLSILIFFIFSLDKQRFNGFNKLVIKINNKSEIRDKFIHTFIADNPKKIKEGLSVVDFINEDEAMLFIFSDEAIHDFWMKAMKFPIDIVWLDKNKEVVFIKEHAEPEDYPKIYKSNKKSFYVLEFIDGFVKKNNINIGYKFYWK